MTQFMHHQLLASVLEMIINQVLSRSAGSAKALEALNDQSLAINLSEFERPFCVHICNSKLLITTPTADSLKADCIIISSIATLIELKSEQQLTELIKQNKLDIDGNIKVAQQFATLIENLDIDWASELEQHIGDIATHKVIALGRAINDKIVFAASQIQADASEYLIYEKALVVTKTELNQYIEQVTTTSSNLEQLTDKIEQLAVKIASHSSSA